MVVHDPKQSPLLTNFDAIELHRERLSTMIGTLGLVDQVAEPLERQVVSSSKDVVGEVQLDFVTDAIGQFEVLPDIVVERVGCRKRCLVARRRGLGLAKHGGG